MFGQQPFFNPSGGGGGNGASQPLQQQQVHPHFNLFPDPNLLFIQQNPCIMAHFNPFFQNPNGFHHVQQQFPNINFPVQINSENSGFQAHHANGYNETKFAQQQVNLQHEFAEKVDKAARNAWKDLLNSNKSVSAWKVSQEALLAVNAESWESLGFQMQRVPSLKSLAVTEGKIDAFIHCFIAARRITSLHDLEVAICKSEGVEQFEELELGPLVQHPLTVHYFSLTSNVTEVYRIRTEEIISYLCQFIDTHKKKEIKVDTFLEFICKKQSVSGWENLCVRIQDFGLYVNHIKQAKRLEDNLLGHCCEKIRKESRKHSKKSPLFSVQKKEMDDHLNTTSQSLKSFPSENTQLCRKHTRFISSSSEDKQAEQLEDNLIGYCFEKTGKESREHSKKIPLFSVQKKEMDDHLNTTSQSLKSFSSENTQFCGTHTRFISSSSEEDDGEDNHDEKNIDRNCNLPIPNIISEHVRSCPYPSINEEMRRLGLKNEVKSKFYMPGDVKLDMDKKHSRRKRRYEDMSPSTSLPHKLPKKEKFDLDIKLKRSDDQSTSSHSLSIESLRTFLTTWKEACRDNNADEIVTREAIPRGQEDSRSISLLVNWVLPYAQRYIFHELPDKYFQLKQSCFENLKHLKIVVVKKLFYRYKIKKCDITSKRKHRCICLLQENILYCRWDSDPHSIFLELSRLLFDGIPQLHFANFLHTITIMDQSGATEEQTEFFILNSQKLPKLPAEESCWSLPYVSSSIENNSIEAEHLSSSVIRHKSDTSSKWPPVDWKTAPGFHVDGLKSPGQGRVENSCEKTDTKTEVNGRTVVVNVPGNLKIALDSVDFVSPDSMNLGPTVCSGNDDEEFAQQTVLTGRLGEHVAFKYFIGRVGEPCVKWVNEVGETGLPYDIVLEGDGDAITTEYVEVKATRFERKNMFFVSIREWQFAIEKGESFSIALVVLGDDNMARLTIYKNPARLCQLGNLKLAVVVPKAKA